MVHVDTVDHVSILIRNFPSEGYCISSDISIDNWFRLCATVTPDTVVDTVARVRSIYRNLRPSISSRLSDEVRNLILLLGSIRYWGCSHWNRSLSKRVSEWDYRSLPYAISLQVTNRRILLLLLHELSSLFFKRKDSINIPSSFDVINNLHWSNAIYCMKISRCDNGNRLEGGDNTWEKSRDGKIDHEEREEYWENDEITQNTTIFRGFFQGLWVEDANRGTVEGRVR